MNASASTPVTLRVTLYSGIAGDSRSYVLTPDTTLGPLQWVQFGKVLDLAGYTNGYAKIEIVSGTGPYVAYAVVNDNTTNDGSYIAAEPASMPAEPRLLPVLVESATFQSELVLTNPLAVPQTATLSYVESASPALGGGGSVTLSFEAGEQKIIPGAIDTLRQHGISIGPKGPTYAGSAVRHVPQRCGAIERLRRRADGGRGRRDGPGRVRTLLRGNRPQLRRPERGLDLRPPAERSEPLEPGRREPRRRGWLR